MNFKKFHESKNMWDFEQWLTDRGATYTKDGNSYTFASQQAMYSTPFYFSQTNITISISGIIEAITATNPRVHLLKADGTRAKTDALTTAVSKYENVSCAGLIFDWSTPGNIKVSLPMLNSGSTSLPYEPYSSEVWHDIPHYIHNTSTDTLTTLPADIYVNDTTATVGLKGQMEQSSQPSPTTPIQPSECGERTAQLFEDKIVNCNIGTSGKLIVNTDFDMYIAKVEQGVTYTASASITGGFYTTKPTIGSTSYNEQRMAFASPTVTAPITGYMTFRVGAGSTVPMFNIGETSLPYEPYGYKIPISSANTTTPVYLGEVQSTRKIGKYIFTGDENITRSVSASNVRMYYVISSAAGASPLYCTHFVDYAQAAGYPPVGYCNFNNISNFIMGVDGTEFETADDFKTWLRTQYTNGNPLTVWYILATPTTGIVNEPIRKIGTYADEVSGITIPTIAGANTLSIGTTLQPSEVTVNYKGWHPVSAVHERESGQWD